MAHNYNSDSDGEDVDIFEQQRLEQWDKIKDFTLDDYLSCDETRFLLFNEWEERFNETQEKLESLFEAYLEQSGKAGCNILAFAEQSHVSSFISLIRHHLTKELNVGIFREEPHLAQPLVTQYDEINKQREKKRREALAQKMKQANKTFDWSTKKYK